MVFHPHPAEHEQAGRRFLDQLEDAAMPFGDHQLVNVRIQHAPRVCQEPPPGVLQHSGLAIQRVDETIRQRQAPVRYPVLERPAQHHDLHAVGDRLKKIIDVIHAISIATVVIDQNAVASMIILVEDDPVTNPYKLVVSTERDGGATIATQLGQVGLWRDEALAPPRLHHQPLRAHRRLHNHLAAEKHVPESKRAAHHRRVRDDRQIQILLEVQERWANQNDGVAGESDLDRGPKTRARAARRDAS
jgi:hypothetical protein